MNTRIAYLLTAILIVLFMWASTFKPKGVRQARGSFAELLIRRVYELGRWFWCLAEALDVGYRHFTKRKEEITVQRREEQLAETREEWRHA